MMKVLTFSLFFFALFADHALAADAYRLKEKIEISGPTISLADLVDGPDVPNDPIFGAPAPGKTGTIQIARIVAAFKKATGKILPVTSDRPVNVIRRARKIAEHDIASALARAIIRDFKIDDPEIRLQPVEGSTEIAVDEMAKGAIVISNLRLDPQSLRFEALLGIHDDAELTKNPIKLQGYVAADRPVPVLTRAIDKGKPVTLDDIRMERRLRTSLDGKTVPALSDITHQVALMPLAVGDVLTDERVGKPQLVEKGSIVTVSYEANGLRLTMRGRATEGGAMGDVVGFTNPQSKKTLFGTVSGEGALRVTSTTTKEARLTNDADTPAQ